MDTVGSSSNGSVKSCPATSWMNRDNKTQVPFEFKLRVHVCALDEFNVRLNFQEQTLRLFELVDCCAMFLLNGQSSKWECDIGK